MSTCDANIDFMFDVDLMLFLILLTRVKFCQVALGQYPEHHFCEEVPCKLIQDFQGELEILSTTIKNRNKSLDIPYTYMDPAVLENSVAI